MDCPRSVLRQFFPTWSSRTRPSMGIQMSESLGSSYYPYLLTTPSSLLTFSLLLHPTFSLSPSHPPPILSSLLSSLPTGHQLPEACYLPGPPRVEGPVQPWTGPSQHSAVRLCLPLSPCCHQLQAPVWKPLHAASKLVGGVAYKGSPSPAAAGIFRLVESTHVRTLGGDFELKN